MASSSFLLGRRPSSRGAPAPCRAGLLSSVTLAMGLVLTGSPPASATDFLPLETLYKGTYRAPPTTAPKPEPNKKVWIIPCGQELVTCSTPAAAQAEAARAIGWTPTIFDGKLDAAVAGEGIRQAIAAKYDAIVLYAVDCAGVKQPLIEARKAGLKIVAAEALDCSDTSSTDQPLFDSTVTYVEGPLSAWLKQSSVWQADYVIDKLDAKAEAITFVSDEVLSSLMVSNAFLDEMKRCPGCKVDRINFSYAKMGPEVQEQAQQALLRYPRANAVVVPSDGLITGVGAAVAASPRKLLVMGEEGQAANMDLVRQGGKQQQGGIATPGRWEGYATIDDLNRVFHGEKGAVSGIGLQIYDVDHNVPPSGAYQPPFDFVAAYKKAWGVDK